MAKQIKVLKTDKKVVKQTSKNKINRSNAIVHTVRKLTMNKNGRASGWVTAKTIHVILKKDGLEIKESTLTGAIRVSSGLLPSYTSSKGVISYRNILRTKVVDGIRMYQYNPKGNHTSSGPNLRSVSYDNVKEVKLV